MPARTTCLFSSVLPALIFAIALLGGARPGLAQSFDCAKAKTVVERAICDAPSDELRRLDGAMADRYRALRREADAAGKTRLLTQQRAFLSQRDSCARVRPPARIEDCLATAYRDRISELDPAAARADWRDFEPDKATCRRQKLALASMAASAAIAFAKEPSKVKEPATLRWRAQSPRRPVAAFLAIAFDAPTRFQGGGFFALTPGADGPVEIKTFKDQTRLFVPLRPGGVGAAGVARFKALRAGPLNISWSIVGATDCGETISSPPLSRSFEIAPGAPSIVIEDPFEVLGPQRTATGPGGEYALKIDATRFRVVDRSSGREILERSGSNPRFSPDGRFIAFETPGAILVLDIAAREDVASADWRADPQFEFAHNGSFYIHSMGVLGAIDVQSTLVDGAGLTLGASGVTMHNTAYDGLRIDLGADLVLHSLKNTGADRLIFTSIANRESGCVEASSSRSESCVTLSQALADRSMLVKRSFTYPSEWELANNAAAATKPINVAEGAPTAPAPIASARAPDEFATRSLRSGLTNLSSGPEGLGQRLETLGLDFREGRRIEQASLELGTARRFLGEEYGSTYDDPLTGRPLRLNQSVWLAEDDNCTMLYEKHGRRLFVGSTPEGRGEQRQWPIAAKAGRFALLWGTCVQGSHRYNYSQALLIGEGGPDRVLDFAETPILDPEGPSGFAGCAENITSCAPKLLLFHERLLAIVSAKSSSVAVFDLTTMTLRAYVANMRRGEQMQTLSLSTDGRWLVQINRDASFALYDLTKSRHIDPNKGASGAVAAGPGHDPLAVQGRYLDDEIVLWRDDLLFDATFEGASMVSVRFDGRPELFALNQFESALREPDLLRKILRDEAPSRRGDVGVPPALDALLLAASAEQFELQTSLRLGGPLDRIEVYQDGLATDTLPVEAAGQPVDLRRLPGARWVTLIGVGRDGAHSAPIAFDLGVGAPGGRLHLLAVGVDQYRDPEIGELNYAAADSKRVTEALQRSAELGETLTLTNDQATRESILQGFERVVGAATPGDTVVLMLAGHGLQSEKDGVFYFASADTSLDDLENTATPWSELAEIAARSKARILVLLDACQSGSAGAEITATNDGAADALLRRGGALTILAASKGRQAAVELEERDGGAFSVAFAEVLSAGAAADVNGNGALELSELYGALKKKVVESAYGLQTPWLVGSRPIGDFAILEIRR